MFEKGCQIKIYIQVLKIKSNEDTCDWYNKYALSLGENFEYLCATF